VVRQRAPTKEKVVHFDQRPSVETRKQISGRRLRDNLKGF
jgi:hypothetical protein